MAARSCLKVNNVTQTAARLFESNLDHLSAEISLLDLRLSREVQRRSQSDVGGIDEDFRGLLVSEEQLAQTLPVWPAQRVAPDSEPDPFLSVIDTYRPEFHQRAAASADILHVLFEPD